MEELYSSQALFYSMTEKYSNFVQIRTLFDSDIDMIALQKALDSAITIYPFFKVKLERRGEALVLVDNDAPLLVYDDVTEPTLEPKSNRDYLIRISAGDKMINFSFCHALTDGRGSIPFLRTLLHDYWINMTGTDPEMPGVRLVGSPVPESELHDPMLDFVPETGDVPLPKNDNPVFQLPVESDTSGAKHVFTFSMKSNAFMEYSHEIDGSPNAIMSLFMARAIQEQHPEADNISAGVAIDFRHALGVTDSHYCEIGILKLHYVPKMRSLDISTCATIFRGMIILQSDDSAVRASLAASLQFQSYMKNLKSLQGKCQMGSYAVVKGSGANTFSVSYTGRQDYGKLNGHIRFQEVIADAQVMHIGIEIMCIGELFFITVTQDFADSLYVKGLIRELETAGIRCTCYTEKTVPYENGPVAMDI